MSDLLKKCTVCNALVYEGDLFCANCGAEAPHAEESVPAQPSRFSTHNFECQGCGASMSYDATSQSLQCPFCGSSNLADRPDVEVLGPNRVVPFGIDEAAAATALRSWLGNGFWRPTDLTRSASIKKMTAVYVPYWIFTARTDTYWTADTNRTPSGARGDWFPLTGSHQGSYDKLMIGASSVLTPAETSRLCPFDLSQAVAADNVDLEASIVEQFRVQRKYAIPLARQGLEERERQSCQQYIPGRHRNLKVNVRLIGLSSEPVLLPVWIMAYQYRDQLYRFLLNGQTGQATGNAPNSWKKMVLIGLAVVLLGGLVLLCAGLSGAIFGR